MRNTFRRMLKLGIVVMVGMVVWIIVNSLMIKSAGDLHFKRTFSAFWLMPVGFSMIMYGVFGPHIFDMFRNKENRKRLRQSGTPAIATLVEIRHTGLIVNNVPKYELSYEYVTVDGYNAIGKEQKLISMLELANFEIGMQLPILYLDNEPEIAEMYLDASKEEIQQIFEHHMLREGKTTQEELEMIHNGAKAIGVITECRPTGQIKYSDIGESAESEIFLRFSVTPSSGSIYELSGTRYISQVSIPKLQVGCTVEICYFHNDPYNIIFIVYADDNSKIAHRLKCHIA